MSQNEYEQERLGKIDAIRKLGFEPYGKSVDFLRQDHNSLCNLAYNCHKWEGNKLVVDHDLTSTTGPEEAARGRIILRRTMGNLHFLTVQDETARFQVALSRKLITNPKEWELAQLLDLGDIIEFEGRIAPTKTNEPTLWATSISISSKCLAPPPSKVEGLVDAELRLRKRYVDLWSNPQVMATMKQRSMVINSIREFLNNRDFEEVETPILQTIPGGAAAKPFTTHHNALGMPLYLRIAPELFLKRLLVGGLPRVFEIGRNFRNEGISTKHNPEFTSLELYQSYSNHERIEELVEDMVVRAIEAIGRPLVINNVNFAAPWRRVDMTELVKEFIATHPLDYVPTTLEQYHEIYDQQVEQTLIHPTFVTGFPSSVVPLAKSKEGKSLSFELVIDGKEIGCGYSEENDPIVQEQQFRAQLGEGDERQKIDTDFLDALRVGMPPAGGLGIGIDRLVMVLTGSASVRDVILFPILKPKDNDVEV